MGYGLKVSRQGYDVNSASDKQLAFSSEWPLLPIEAEGSKELTASTAYDEALYTHNLGYIPVFYVWEENSSRLYPGAKTTDPIVYATTTTLYIEHTPSENCTLHWKVFRRGMLTNYDSGTTNSTDATEGDSGDFGIIASLQTKSVHSTDKRDFSFRSDVRQLMVHMSGYTDAVFTDTITHNLGYAPMYWFYGEYDTGKYGIYGDTDDFVISSTSTEFSWTYEPFDETAKKFAYILFKDPINLGG